MRRFDYAPLGDEALCVFAPGESVGLARHLRTAKIPGVSDVVPAFDHLGIYFQSDCFEQSALEEALSTFNSESAPMGKSVAIPICYELESDIESVSVRLGITVDSVVSCHLESKVTCRAIGFCPGFPYLAAIHPTLSGLARKDSPAVRVEPGTVAITGEMCGIYTLPRPGGWWQIGRTPLALVDVADRYFPIAVGDQVTFKRIDRTDFDRLLGERL